jgi:hypothetical protein
MGNKDVGEDLKLTKGKKFGFKEEVRGWVEALENEFRLISVEGVAHQISEGEGRLGGDRRLRERARSFVRRRGNTEHVHHLPSLRHSILPVPTDDVEDDQ